MNLNFFDNHYQNNSIIIDKIIFYYYYIPEMDALHVYIDIMLKSSFPQTNLCNQKKFLDFLNRMGINLCMDQLENFHKTGILNPVAKIRNPEPSSNEIQRRIHLEDIDAIKSNYASGSLKLEEGYEAWNDLEGPNSRSYLYYHPFQFLPVREFVNRLRWRPGVNFFDENFDFSKWYTEYKDYHNEQLGFLRNSYRNKWIPAIGLLILLDEPYGPYVKNYIIGDSEDDDVPMSSWKEWRFRSFNPKKLLETSGMSLERIREIHDSFCREGRFLDPLSNWYPLQRIISRTERMRLRNEAFSAQIYYDFAIMISYFYFDLTGEKLPDPDDITDKYKGKWKEHVYGSPFDYLTKKTQKKILDSYLIDRLFQFGIIVEGDSEEKAIDMICKALRVDKNREGFFVYNSGGQDNMISLSALYDFSKLDNIEIFLILDNDKHASDIQDKLKMKIKDKNTFIWNIDFEYDNFGTTKTLEIINREIKLKNLIPIDERNILENMTKKKMVLMNAIDAIMKDKNGDKLQKFLSKKTLTEILISPRVTQIEEERFKSGWKPILPIEKRLEEIFKGIPHITHANAGPTYM